MTINFSKSEMKALKILLDASVPIMQKHAAKAPAGKRIYAEIVIDSAISAQGKINAALGIGG